jgi:predicted phage-related endonuclease
MVWGVEHEAEARAAYEFRTDQAVTLVGFVQHPKIELSGASPDGLVGGDGLVEIKAPNTATHIDTLLGQSVPGKYIQQIQWQMATTGRKWCDFVSYDPRMPETMRFFCRRIARDDAMIAELESEVVAFLAEVALTVERLKTVYEKP